MKHKSMTERHKGMNISIIGCGRWGSFITWYLDGIGHDVTLIGRNASTSYRQLVQQRSNGNLSLRNSIKLVSDLGSVRYSDIIVISINSQGLRGLMSQLQTLELHNKTIVLCMKGLEIGTGRRLSQVVSEHVDNTNRIAVWIGPGHVEDFCNGIPNCMVIDSESESVKEKLINAFSSELIRFYLGNDLIGNEIGAAAKNVIGIAAGMLDGLNLSSLKGALMTRGTREISRLMVAMGGSELSAYGLCHLGDYQATLFSQYSHNRRFGECLVIGETYDRLAEGYYTVKALKDLSVQYNVELPICNAVYQVIYNEKDPKEVLNNLLLRSVKREF